MSTLKYIKQVAYITLSEFSTPIPHCSSNYLPYKHIPGIRHNELHAIKHRPYISNEAEHKVLTHGRGNGLDGLLALVNDLTLLIRETLFIKHTSLYLSL